MMPPLPRRHRWHHHVPGRRTRATAGGLSTRPPAGLHRLSPTLPVRSGDRPDFGRASGSSLVDDHSHFSRCAAGRRHVAPRRPGPPPGGACSGRDHRPGDAQRDRRCLTSATCIERARAGSSLSGPPVCCSASAALGAGLLPGWPAPPSYSGRHGPGAGKQPTPGLRRDRPSHLA